MLKPIPPAPTRLAIRKAILQHWPRYRDVRVTHELVELDDLLTVIPMASHRRIRDAHALLKMYSGSGIQPYLPARLSDGSANGGLLFSPLVELNKGELILLDGMHRCLAARDGGIRVIVVIVIRPFFVPPPVAQGLPLDRVVYSRPGQEPPIFFEGLELPDFRPGRLFVDTAVRLLDEECG